MDFLIFYEHIVREYENNLLLKNELEKRGYKVKMINTVSVEYWMSFFSNAKVIVVPALYDDTITYYYSRSLFKKREKIINLQYEQVLSKSWEEVGYHNPKGEAKKGYHLSWGRANYERLLSAGLSSAHLKRTGPIQFDLLRPEFKTYFLSREELADKYKLDTNKKWILYISSFTYPSFDKKEMQVHINKNKGLEELRDSMTYSRNKTFEWVSKLLTSSSDVVYIYRPHPSEYNDPEIIKMENKYAGFKVIRDESVKQWILSSDVINTWYSTSIMEAYYAEKPCLIVRPSTPPKQFDSVLYEDCLCVNNVSTFMEKNQSLKFDKKSFPIQKDLINYHYGENSDMAVYKKICDYLEEVLLDKNKRSKFVFKSYKNKSKVFKFFVRSLYGDFTRYSGIKLSKILPLKKQALENAEKYSNDFNIEILKNKNERIKSIIKK